MKIIETIINGIKIITRDESDDLSDDKLQKDRNIICDKCDSNNNGICDKCGCIILSKIIYKNSSCPINKW